MYISDDLDQSQSCKLIINPRDINGTFIGDIPSIGNGKFRLKKNGETMETHSQIRNMSTIQQ